MCLYKRDLLCHYALTYPKQTPHPLVAAISGISGSACVWPWVRRPGCAGVCVLQSQILQESRPHEGGGKNLGTHNGPVVGGTEESENERKRVGTSGEEYKT